ncbi:MAG: hypothetical protein ABIH11_07815 [Candidatus Altiarchaeota archaeon]
MHVRRIMDFSGKTLLMLMITLVLSELVLNIIGTWDDDGEYSFHARFRPYTLPVRLVTSLIDEYESRNDSLMVSDPHLGWAIRGNVNASDGLYESNSAGIRSPREFSFNKTNNTLRVGLFGDSFIYGAEVPYGQSIGSHLEDSLPHVEALNFAVGGYGIDQSYLMWVYRGSNYSLDVVIIGFQPENCMRNENIFRIFYYRNSRMPFSKPRFLFSGEGLDLVNHPTIDYRKIPAVIMDFDSHPLSRHEHYYDPRDYSATNPLYYSKLVSSIYSIMDLRDYDLRQREYYADGSPGAELCYRIIRRFVNESSRNSEVYILHLPIRRDLEMRMKGEDYYHQPLLTRLSSEFNVIDPAPELLEAASKNGVESIYPVHYSGKANAIIAGKIVGEVFSQRPSQSSMSRE